MASSALSDVLSPDKLQAINAAAASFDVDPALIASVYGKESSFGKNGPASDPFWQFGLIYGPGNYNGYGYATDHGAANDTFGNAAKTVAAMIASARADFNAGKAPQGQSFLQYFDGIYSPPSVNPNSFTNLKTLYSSLGGNVTGEAHTNAPGSNSAGGSKTPENTSNSGGVWSLVNGAWKWVQDPLSTVDVNTKTGDVTQSTPWPSTGQINTWLWNAGALSVAIALLGGAFAILATSPQALRAEGTVIGAAAKAP